MLARRPWRFRPDFLFHAILDGKPRPLSAS
jgi:hypothetical protein